MEPNEAERRWAARGEAIGEPCGNMAEEGEAKPLAPPPPKAPPKAPPPEASPALLVVGVEPETAEAGDKSSGARLPLAPPSRPPAPFEA